MLEHELEKTIKRLRTISAGAEGLLRALYRCREEAVAELTMVALRSLFKFPLRNHLRLFSRSP